MNQSIRIYVPKALHLHDIIQAKYTELYRQWRRANPTSRDYPIIKLRQNIAKAYSVVKQSFPQTSFKQSTFIPWSSKGWYELYHFHWYFAISFVKDRRGNIRAQIEDAHYEGEHHNDTLTSQPYDESQIRNSKIVLKENDIRNMVRRCIREIIQESASVKRIGKYTAIDGDWWDGIPKGLESKGCGLQDVRMYDYKNETIALWRRCDNLKYFYAKIVPDKGKDTKWQAMKLSEVPIVIRNDFSTINPLGHEPYLPF
ncbi:MAG: hypothetical protein MJY58_02175 [Bacteroidaceae bacterium]|nr:hypothetical protein [Bacteroidaceae bacterium]